MPDLIHDHPINFDELDTKAIPTEELRKIIKPFKDGLNNLQDRIEAQGGLRKVTKRFLNNKLSEAFGFDFFKTVEDTYHNQVVPKARKVLQTTFNYATFGSAFINAAIEVLPP